MIIATSLNCPHAGIEEKWLTLDVPQTLSPPERIGNARLDPDRKAKQVDTVA